MWWVQARKFSRVWRMAKSLCAPLPALAAAALTAAIGLASQGQWYGAAAALAVAILLGEVGRRQRRGA